MKFVLILSFIISFSLKAETCEKLFDNHMKTDMNLSYQEFDQSPGRGFRSLANPAENQTCYQEAADLIEVYILKNNIQKRSLGWHVAQLRGYMNDYTSAIKWARSVLSESEDFNKNPLRWNDYVLGTIAFWERDKKKLIFHAENLQEGEKYHFGNELNLKYLKSLIRNFDKDYSYASLHINE